MTQKTNTTNVNVTKAQGQKEIKSCPQVARSTKKRNKRGVGVLQNTIIPCCIGVIAAIAVIASIHAIKVAGAKQSPVRTELTSDGTAYAICNVTSYTIDADGTTLYVTLPNGESDMYLISDKPEGELSEVCLKLVNPEDATTYEVVAIR